MTALAVPLEEVVLQGGGLLRGIDAGAVLMSDDAVDGGAVFESAELFEPFGEFEKGGRPGYELLEKGAGVAVEPHVPPRGNVRVGIPLKGERAAAEIEGPAGVVEDGFDNIGIVLKRRIVKRVDGSDHADRRIGGEAGGEFTDKSRGNQRFVALNVDEVGGGGVVQGGLGESISATGVIPGSEDSFGPKSGSGVHNARVIGGDEHAGKAWAGHATAPRAFNQGLPGNEVQRFARKTGGAVTGGDDGGDAGHGWVQLSGISC